MKVKINECIFCKIIKGELSSNKIYEDDYILAITPKKSEAKGHTLIIPKKHCDTIFDCEDVELKRIILGVKRISLAIRKGLKAKGVNILNASGKVAQQSVSHLHFHIIPRFENDGVDAWMKKSDLKEYDINEITLKIKKALR